MPHILFSTGEISFLALPVSPAGAVSVHLQRRRLDAGTPPAVERRAAPLQPAQGRKHTSHLQSEHRSERSVVSEEEESGAAAERGSAQGQLPVCKFAAAV